jgi:hypothetical protein
MGGRIGIDKVRLVGPVDRFPDGPHLDRKSRADGVDQASYTFSKTYCEVTRLEDGRVLGAMEATPAYVLGESSNLHVPGDATIGMVANRMAEAFEKCMEVELQARDVDELAVNRLDLVRDCVADPAIDLPSYLRGLGSHRPKYGRKRALYLGENGAQTLSTGSGARMGRAYDKFEETKRLPAAEGVIRFEAQYRKRALNREGVKYLRDAGTDSLERIRAGAWDHFGYGLQVLNVSALRDFVMERVAEGEMSENAALSMVGALVLGLDWVSERHARRHRAKLSTWGVAADLDGLRWADLSADPVMMQADYESGRVVSYAA